ncbi:MAG: hypothetical protein MZU91_02375 [Desulfosudis oleivorans]|nr:hypothetical protein [Desulfosudis oleivorans]
MIPFSIHQNSLDGANEKQTVQDIGAVRNGFNDPRRMWRGGSDTQAPAEKAKVVIFVGFGTGTDPDQVAAQDALAKKFNEFARQYHDGIPDRAERRSARKISLRWWQAIMPRNWWDRTAFQPSPTSWINGRM